MIRAADSALLVEVPAAEPIVSRHRSRWDFIAAWGVPAHLTVLYPFMPPALIGPEVLERLSEDLAGVPAFELRLTSCSWFDDQALWLAPEDSRPLAKLIELVSAAFPSYPPYEGQFAEVVPHLTVGDTGGRAELARVQAEVTSLLPVSEHVSAVTLLESDGGSSGYRFRAQFDLGRS